MYFILKSIVMLLFSGLCLFSGSQAAEVVTGTEAQTGRLTWEWRDNGVSVQLVQLLPDQTRAFYLGRGFGSADADAIARTCFFQTIFRNDGKLPLSYDLDDWRVILRDEQRPLLTRERWDERLREGPSSQAARIALRWALLPTRQAFQAGDYNWGMTSFGLLPGETFDLLLTLTIGTDRVNGRIPHIRCAAEQTSK